MLTSTGHAEASSCVSKLRKATTNWARDRQGWGAEKRSKRKLLTGKIFGKRHIERQRKRRKTALTNIRIMCYEGGKVHGSGSGSGLWYQRADASSSVTKVSFDYEVYGEIQSFMADKREKVTRHSISRREF